MAEATSSNASASTPVILSQIVSLLAHGLTISNDDEVWLDGLRMLAEPKLHRSLSMTSPIWMPLLQRSLTPTRSPEVIIAGLKLLARVADLIEAMRPAFVKPFKALVELDDDKVMGAPELYLAVEGLGLEVMGKDGRPLGQGAIVPPPRPDIPRPADVQHPLLTEILTQCMPARTRDVRQAWTATLLSGTGEANVQWMRAFFRATIEASRVPELVITARLDHHVHEELFPTAFMHCYAQIEADTIFKDKVDDALIRVLSSPGTSKEVVQTVLELLAFMDKQQLTMPAKVMEAAMTSVMNDFGDLNKPLPAVNLWFAEQEALRTMQMDRLGDLVEANIRIGPSGYDAAWSTLQWVRDDYDVSPDPMWITQLAHWNRALDAQQEADGGHVGTFGSFNTRMVCYHALGQFDKGYALAQALYEGLNDYERRETSHWATAAAWHMGDYEAMSDYLAFHPKGTSKSLYKAIIDVQSGNYAPAFQHISKAQTLAYDELQAKLNIGPQEGLKTLAKTEYLVELQEVIQYRSQPDQRQQILSNWRARFKRSHQDSSSWLRRLQIWGLACEPTTWELQVCYLDLAKLCESQGMHEAAQRIIKLVTPEVTPPGCKVEYTQFRFLWKDAYDSKDYGAMSSVLSQMRDHASLYLDHLGIQWESLQQEGLGMQPVVCASHIPREDRRTLARRLHRLGQWTEAMSGLDWITDPASEVYRHYMLACKLDDTWFTGSYSLATAAMAIFETRQFDKKDSVALNSYVVPAVRGLFQAVRAEQSPERMIKALLRLVTIWFRYGESESVLAEVEYQLVSTPITSWLCAIPQLIARLGTKHRDLQGVLVGLLKSIASAYPHAIIWPLMTASQTINQEHQEAAKVIMNHIATMRDGATLVSQAETVGRELIRVSISWMEKWRNIIDKTLPRTDLMEVPWHEVPDIWRKDYEELAHPETPDEDAFVQRFGRSIELVYKTLVRYRSTRSVGYVNTAYTEVYKLFGDLDAGIAQQYKVPNAKLSIQNTAPKLLLLKDCILTVPGQYDPQVKLDDQAFIDSFPTSVSILASKMIPRKLTLTSWRAQRDDFTSYTFLLKGNEDLRGDERIMQLFNLINTLLNHSSEAFSRNLHLLPYEVIPLSPSAGLVSWVSNTQQLQSMIVSNREKNKKVYLSDKELASMLGYDPETFNSRTHNPPLDLTTEMEKHVQLPNEIKAERLKAAWSHSEQTEIKETLWQRSPTAEVWIKRRTNFARTLGVGSMVGHVIGLGDRHGSNILVDQLTWTALHIDFGDLFCIAQERSYLPEKVPFRLTRMMTNAMEMASNNGNHCPGSRGSYKQASIVSMNVLRENRGSLLAMLEAFLYDPLLSWTSEAEPSNAKETTKTTKNDQKSSTDVISPQTARQVNQSVAPARAYGPGNSDPYKRIESSLLEEVGQDSWIAKIAVGGMTNARALKVLAVIEKKLAGLEKGEEQAMSIKQQVQYLIEEATDPINLAQGYVLGWLPQW